jgi:hypothetical protein
MTAVLLRMPKFHRLQKVSFAGGEGIVRSSKFEFGSWVYLVEMALGVEPVFGRVGAETMVLLEEVDLRAI